MGDAAGEGTIEGKECVGGGDDGNSDGAAEF
jgi:hypothetical protein